MLSLWDTETAQQIAVLREQTGVYVAAFSPDGARVITISKDGNARIWGIDAIPSGNLFAVTCAELPDHDLNGLVSQYGLGDLDPICQDKPPLPDRLPR